MNFKALGHADNLPSVLSTTSNKKASSSGSSLNLDKPQTSYFLCNIYDTRYKLLKIKLFWNCRLCVFIFIILCFSFLCVNLMTLASIYQRFKALGWFDGLMTLFNPTFPSSFYFVGKTMFLLWSGNLSPLVTLQQAIKSMLKSSLSIDIQFLQYYAMKKLLFLQVSFETWSKSVVYIVWLYFWSLSSIPLAFFGSIFSTNLLEAHVLEADY